MKRLLHALVAIAFVLQTSCAHTSQNRFARDLDETRCEDALAHLPEHDPAVLFLDNTQLVAGHAASYFATGAAYVAEAIVTVAGGTAILLALCAPMIMLAMHGQSTNELICIPADLSGLRRPRLREAAYDSTRSWRCPDLDQSSRSIRKVAECLSSRGDAENLQKAQAALQGLANSSKFNECSSPDESSLVRSQLDSIDGKILKLPGS